MRRTRLVPILEVSMAVVVWGASFIATKVVLRDVSPVTVVWLRFAMGVAILGAAVATRRQFLLPGWKDLAYLAVIGFLGITFHQWLQSTGLETAQAATSAWIVATTPVFMALLGWLALKERLSAVQAGGIGLAALGVLLVVSKGDFGSLAEGRFGAPGDLLLLISAINWAVFSALSKRGLEKFPAAVMMFYVMSLGWLFTSVQLAAGPGLSEIGRLSFNGWLGVIFLGVACTGLAYIFWYDALQVIPASQLGAFLYVEPLVAMVVAAVILGEPVLWVSVLGGAAILVGVWLVQRNGAGKPAVEAPELRSEGNTGGEVSRIWEK